MKGALTLVILISRDLTQYPLESVETRLDFSNISNRCSFNIHIVFQWSIVDKGVRNRIKSLYNGFVGSRHTKSILSHQYQYLMDMFENITGKVYLKQILKVLSKTNCVQTKQTNAQYIDRPLNFNMFVQPYLLMKGHV